MEKRKKKLHDSTKYDTINVVKKDKLLDKMRHNPKD